MSTQPSHLASMMLAGHDSLEQQLVDSLSNEAQKIFLSELFDIRTDYDDILQRYSSHKEYFFYYQEQCLLAYHKASLDAPYKTHRNVLNLAKIVKIKSLQFGHDRSTIMRELRSGFEPKPDDHVLLDWIDFAARILLMMQIGGFQGVMMPGQIPLRWPSEDCLRDVVHRSFKPRTSLKEPVKLEKLFKAMNLERIAGLQIVWTSNLPDHLRLQDDDTRVVIFHYASYLQWHKNRSVREEMMPAVAHIIFWESRLTWSRSHLFPDGFVEETLRTITLLLPQYDNASAKWYLSQTTHYDLDPKAMKCGQLSAEDRHISNFVFWHDRLVILKQIFDEAEPKNISQWWHDRRKGVQWYTFWVAAIVLCLNIVFGLIQCVEGGLQVYKAYSRS